MARQSSAQTGKLVFFWLIVIAALGAIHTLNRRVRDREAALSDEGNETLAKALRRLDANPGTLSMTMGPGTQNERQLRHANASLVGGVDVLVLGQSDADHMSQTFFRDGVRFYNGFISNSYFAYQYEVFEDIVTASGVPDLVLVDVSGHGYLLQPGDEATFDMPADDPRWWAGVPYQLGKGRPLPWYEDVESLLSLEQTKLTYRAMKASLLPSAGTQSAADPDVDTGAPFLDVALGAPSSVHRWMADGSRVYPREVNGILVPRGQAHPEIGDGKRQVNPARLPSLEQMLRKLRRAGATVILYSPPVRPDVFADGTQSAPVASAEAGLRALASEVGVDYCGLGMEAKAIGCGEADFYDELHISRQCNAQVLRRMARGCAAGSAGLLRRLLKAELID